jgi:hypothetical protein
LVTSRIIREPRPTNLQLLDFGNYLVDSSNYLIVL